ncbi:MAG: AAA family ATPase [Planctomycetaceae bacterium]|nr:AAA family ATPase [Planctomycetaceae bacterium]
MYEAFFGLHKRPFAATPDPECFVPVGDAQTVLDDLTQCVRDGRGIGVVSAAAGLGKTLLCRKLARDLESEWAIIWLPTCSFPSRRALLQSMLYELGHPYARLSESEMRLALAESARGRRPNQRGVVILIDEAHQLNEKLLEELRGLTNHVDGGESLFHVVLSGQLELDELLAAPKVESFRQRIGCQTTIQPLTQSDSVEYLAHRLQWSGANLASVLTADAARLIAHASDGSPRCLNQLADQALLLGYVADQKPVGVDVVHQALEDLRQLPLNWNIPSPINSQAEESPDDIEAEESDEAAELVSDPGAAETIASQDHSPAHSAWETSAPADAPSTVAAASAPAFPTDLSTEGFASIEVGGPATPIADASPAPIEPASPSELPAMPATTVMSESNSIQNAPEPRPATVASSGAESAPERRVRRRPRGPRKAIEFQEEVIVDRYAQLDAGKMVEPVAASAEWSDEAPRQPRPDELIDRIIPMIDAALSMTGGPVPTDTPADNIPRSLHREVARTFPIPEPIDSDDAEQIIGAAVLDQCLETQREVVSRLGESARDQFEAGLRAMTEEELRDEAPLPSLPATMTADSQPLENLSTSGPFASKTANESTVPLRDAAPRRQYSQLFSALRKKLRRPA